MILVEVVQVKRVNDVFHLNGVAVPSSRRASDGYGVMVVAEPSQLDKDMEAAVGPGKFCFFITAAQFKRIGEALDLSDVLTRDHLRNGKGWKTGPRPVASLGDYL